MKLSDFNKIFTRNGCIIKVPAINRMRDYCSSKGLSIHKEVSEIGSGSNENRKKLIALLKDDTITHIIVEYKDRLTRFGFNFIESALNSSGRKIVVLNETERS